MRFKGFWRIWKVCEIQRVLEDLKVCEIQMVLEGLRV